MDEEEVKPFADTVKGLVGGSDDTGCENPEALALQKEEAKAHLDRALYDDPNSKIARDSMEEIQSIREKEVACSLPMKP